MTTERTCYCPTCGFDTKIPTNLGPGQKSICVGCEGCIEFPGGAALWFTKVSELTLNNQELGQLRQMRAHLRQQKATH